MDQRVYCSKKGKPDLPSDCEAVLLTRAKKVMLWLVNQQTGDNILQ